MKQLMVTGVILLSWVAGEAMAACTDAQITGTDLSNLISGNTVCASAGGDQWQEQHRTGGALWDYKKGPTDPVDPTKQVGTWSFDNQSTPTTITYQYGASGPSYTYTVHGASSGTYSFCNGGSEVVSNAMFKNGESSCP